MKSEGYIISQVITVALTSTLLAIVPLSPSSKALLFVIITITLIVGWLYANQIVERPFPSNKTSHSVVIGVILTQLFIGTATLIVLQYFGVLEKLWGILLFPIPAYMITGIPQMYVEKKKDEEEAAKMKINQEL